MLVDLAAVYSPRGLAGLRARGMVTIPHAEGLFPTDDFQIGPKANDGTARRRTVPFDGPSCLEIEGNGVRAGFPGRPPRDNDLILNDIILDAGAFIFRPSAAEIERTRGAAR